MLTDKQTEQNKGEYITSLAEVEKRLCVYSSDTQTERNKPCSVYRESSQQRTDRPLRRSMQVRSIIDFVRSNCALTLLEDTLHLDAADRTQIIHF